MNLGSSEEVSMNELAERIVKNLGSSSPIEHLSYDEAYGPGFDDMMQRIPDLARAKSLIDWSPKYTLDDIIHQVHTNDTPQQR